MEPRFAVIDTETTGLSPDYGDRVIEMAIVNVLPNGEIVDRWETLINPYRDLGRQDIHGITNRDILSAPAFADVADEIAWRLSGSIIVGHNIAFDAKFLDAEFAVTPTRMPANMRKHTMCTMRMARQYLQAADYKLTSCCVAVGHAIPKAHSAGDDAYAAAVLLQNFLRINPTLADAAAPLPSKFAQPTQLIQPALRNNIAPRPQRLMERLSPALGTTTGRSEVAATTAYRAELERAMLDLELTEHEAKALLDHALASGLTLHDVQAIHEEYFDMLVERAWDDGILTDTEIKDLDTIGEILSIDAAKRAAAHTPRNQGAPPIAPTTGVTSGGLALGSMIVLTGSMQRPREDIERAIRAAGYVTHDNVTKKVKLLVASDPDSQSGKARKARDYGIPVVSEAYLFERILGGVPVAPVAASAPRAPKARAATPMSVAPQPAPHVPIQPQPAAHVPIQPQPAAHVPIQPQPAPHVPIQPQPAAQAHSPNPGVPVEDTKPGGFMAAIKSLFGRKP